MTKDRGQSTEVAGIVMIIQRILKYLLSFLRRDWQLSDYPIEARDLSVEPLPGFSGLRYIRWLVRIPHWLLMAGTGDTREEAFAELQRRFEEYKSEGNLLPRPGTKVPIKFAPSVRIDRYERIAQDFFPRIVNMDYENVLITDESSLFDLMLDVDEVQIKIREVYEVDVRDIEDGNLARILERIEISQASRTS
jgi:predicted RNase H-like HicB family nuclease